MPIYTFKNPNTEEEIEVVQSMTDEHTHTDKNGVEWQRIYHSPNSAIDTKSDGSFESFMRNTANKKGTMGELWDASHEASEARVKERGHDKVQKKHFKNYSDKRHGMKHENENKNKGDSLI